MTAYIYIAENFPIIFVLTGFAYFLITQREINRKVEKKFYWMMIACSVILLIVVPWEVKVSHDYALHKLRVLLSVIGYWVRPAALMFLGLACLKPGRQRIYFIIPEIVNIIIMGMALFTKFPFYYSSDNGFHRSNWGYTTIVIGFIYMLALLIIGFRQTINGHKLEGGILFVCILISTLSLIYAYTTSYELVSFSIAISGFFHYVLNRSQKHYYDLHAQVVQAENAKKTADNANKAKTQFLFNASHDIRTPMNAIIGFSDILDRHADDPQMVRNCTEKIRQSSNYLLTLINEMLEMSRIESGKLTVNLAPTKISKIIDSTRTIFDSQFKDKNIDFEVITDIKHDSIYCDATKVFEVIFNLLSNSLKYTNPGGKVLLEVIEAPEEPANPEIWYHTKIKDSGIGMSEEYLPHVFEEFSREHTSTESKVTGTGLGMPIVKKLVELMEGKITISSELNVGTEIVVSFATAPYNGEISDEVQATETNSINAESIHLLLVEDNELNAEIATTILSEEGYNVTRACDGVECINMLSNKSSEEYNLILMDIQMPNLDGYETTKRIRALQDKTIANIPVIAMTANAFEEDKVNSLDAGMNDFISKPFDLNKLKEMINKYVLN